MVFVTVNWPLTTTGTVETADQTAGAARFVVDCKENPELLAGHVKMIAFAAALNPAGLAVTASTTEGGVANVGEKAAVLSPALPWLKSIPPT